MNTRGTADSLTDLPAPAKLNVFLRVVGRRADGYHLLQSLFVLLDWHDTLHLERRRDGQLHRHDLTVPLPEDDLCLKAARALQAASGSSWGADIHIHKVLPSGAGLGGGSSDAATVLLGLNRLWGLGWSRQRLIDLAVGLGADVPFFLGGGSAIVEGIGERLSPVDIRPRGYVVVKPPVGVETRRIFTDPGLTRDSKPAIVEGFLADPTVLDGLLDGESTRLPLIPTRRSAQRGHPQEPIAYLASGTASPLSPEAKWEIANDLQPVALRLEPQVEQAITWLQSRWGNGQMTGSGSAAFARETADNAPLMAALVDSTAFAELPAGWVGRCCRSLARHPLGDWAG